MTSEVSNFIVVIHGRGVLHTCLAKGTEEDVKQKAEGCLLSGFEVHLYSLKLATNSRPSYLPEGVNPLQQEFHLWDAQEEFEELTSNITMHLDEHTIGMSKRYIQQCIEQLQEELAKLEPESSERVEEPTFGGPENPTTGT